MPSRQNNSVDNYSTCIYTYSCISLELTNKAYFTRTSQLQICDPLRSVIITTDGILDIFII